MSFLLSFQGVVFAPHLDNRDLALSISKRFSHSISHPTAKLHCWGLGTGTRLPNMLTQIRFEERNQTMVLDGPGQKPDLELAIPTGTDFHYHPSKDLNM